MIELEFFIAKEDQKKAKCTLHKTGKFGFSKGAEEMINLSIYKSVRIGHNKEDSDKSKELYMQFLQEKEEGAFKVSKAGSYFYTNVKSLFDSIGINYRDTKRTYIYDIIEFNHNNIKLYKLMRRIKEKK